PDQALEALEKNRARLLAEALDLEETAIHKASAADRSDFDATRRTISSLETAARSLEPGSSRAFVDLSAKLRAARSRLSSVAETTRSSVPDFLPADLDLAAVVDLARTSGQSLVFLVSSPHGSLALIVASGESHPEIVWLDSLSSFDLRDLLLGS